MTDGEAADAEADVETEAVRLEVGAELTLPHDGPHTFDPLARTLASGELADGTPYEVTNEGGVRVRFGTCGEHGELAIPYETIIEAGLWALHDAGHMDFVGGDGDE